MARTENAALKAILTSVEDPAERERITGAFHSLSNGDHNSIPVAFALVANGVAMSIVESASEIKAAVKESIGSLPKQTQNTTTRGRFRNWINWVCAVIGVAGILAMWVAYASRSQLEASAALTATQIKEHGQLLADLQTSGGTMRYYEAQDVNGKKIRILLLNGGSVRPTEAFINASGAATVIWPALTKPQNH